MKNTQLFDILGEIDDKFYEEAKQTDAQEPVELTAEKRGVKKTIIGIIMSAAACIAVAAAIGIGIKYIDGNLLLQPNVSLSKYTAFDENNTDVQPQVILDEKELEGCRVLLLGHNVEHCYMFAELGGGDPRHDVTYSNLFIALEKDGKVVAKSEDLDIGYLSFDRLSEYIQPFELKDGKGFVMYSYIGSKTGSARLYSIKGNRMIRLRDAKSADAGAESEITPSFTADYESNALVCGSSTVNISFADNSYTISEEMSLEGYLDYDQDSTELQPKVIFGVKEVGGHKIYLLGDNVRNRLILNNPFACPSRLFIAVEKDGRIVDTVNAESNMPLIPGEADSCVQAFEMKDGIGFAMRFTVDPADKEDMYNRIYKIDNGRIVRLKSDSEQEPDFASSEQHYMGINYIVVSEDNALARDGKTITVNFAESSYAVQNDIERIKLADYKMYDEDSAELQPKVIFEIYDVGEYRVSLLGNYVQNGEYAGCDAVFCSVEFVAVEKDGKLIDVIAVNAAYVGRNFIRPFELKDGKGFLIYCNFETWVNSSPYCKAYIIKDDRLINISNERYMYVEPDFKTEADENAIYDDEVKITINFINNTFIKH